MSMPLALGGSLTAAAAAPRITEYEFPGGQNTNPLYMVAGPGGQVWFADEGLNAVQTLYNAGGGSMAFTDTTTPAIGEITLTSSGAGGDAHICDALEPALMAKWRRAGVGIPLGVGAGMAGPHNDTRED